jgi:predicted AlkP superfamily pyrophosphatase or phosphodiesterase
VPRKRKQLAKHVILISIDGFRPRYYLEEGWPAPTVRQLYLAGAHATAVRAIFPSLTYPSHVTLVTGALPARHGVYNNRVMEPTEDPEWLSLASDIRVPTLWDAVHDAGGTTVALNWPLSAGAPIDWNVPDMWPGSDEALIEATRSASTPGALEELEREATGRLRLENFSSKLLAHDVRLATMAAYLYEVHRPTLSLIHCEGVVQIQQEPDWRNPRKLRAIAAADLAASLVVEIIERSESWNDTAVIVTGDHGMTEIHTQLRPNVWLVEAGLRPRRLDGNAWRATFHAIGGAAMLRVQEPAQENLDAVIAVLESLPDSVRRAFRVLHYDELVALGSDPEAPLALACAPGFVMDSSAEPPVQKPNPGMSHGHHPDVPDMDTGLVAYGAGIRAGVCAPLLHLTDVAPLVAALLGLDFDAPDGELYEGLLER